MTPQAQIAATIELLAAIAEAPRPADSVVSGYLRARRYIGGKDRSAILARTYAVLRHKARLGWHLDRAAPAAGPAPTPRGEVLAWLVLGEGARLTDVEPLFDGSHYGPDVLSAEEKRRVRALALRPLDDPEMPDAVRAELPDWAVEPLKRRFGDRFEAEAAALGEEAPLDLRVNLRHGNRDAVLAALEAAGITARPGRWSPTAIRVTGRPPLAGNPLFKSGAIEIQDEGSQLVAWLADVAPGMQVVDFCAGAGGKALAMGDRMAGKGRIVACDVSEGRLRRTRERLRRAGLDNIEPRLLVGERDRWVKRHKASFDRVLIDAPCSGTGAWRRNPDARWRPLDLDRLTATQDAILESAARLVKPGGRLVYATCSLLGQENEEQVARFLDRAEGRFRRLPAADVWRAALGTEPPEGCGQDLFLTPASHGTDGFYAAILERVEDGGEPVTSRPLVARAPED